MSRPVGSKNRVKKDAVPVDTILKRKEPAPKRVGVLKISPWLYIIPDSRSWIVKEVVKDGKDRSLFYFSSLAEAIKGCAKRMIQVPGDVQALSKQIDSVYSLIDSRIPADVKPKDLFEFEEVF